MGQQEVPGSPAEKIRQIISTIVSRYTPLRKLFTGKLLPGQAHLLAESN